MYFELRERRVRLKTMTWMRAVEVARGLISMPTPKQTGPERAAESIISALQYFVLGYGVCLVASISMMTAAGYTITRLSGREWSRFSFSQDAAFTAALAGSLFWMVVPLSVYRLTGRARYALLAGFGAGLLNTATCYPITLITLGGAG
jgi:hypothetical protein